MTIQLTNERAYQSILSYASPQIKDIVARQIPIIEKSIDEEIQAFGEELSLYIKDVVEEKAKDIQDQVNRRIEVINKAIEAIDAGNASMVELRQATATLRKELDDHKELWTGAGESLQKLVLNKVGLTGLPI